MLKRVDKAFYTAVRDTAKASDFKKIFEGMAFGGEYSLSRALETLYGKDVEMNKTIVDHVNDDSRYSPYILSLVANLHSFKGAVIPTRKCDFFVKDAEQVVFFYVEERMEITHDLKDNKLYLAKLMVDDKSDSLLYNEGNGQWIEYGKKRLDSKDPSTVFEANVAQEYKSFLAETQLLKD